MSELSIILLIKSAVDDISKLSLSRHTCIVCSSISLRMPNIYRYDTIILAVLYSIAQSPEQWSTMADAYRFNCSAKGDNDSSFLYSPLNQSLTAEVLAPSENILPNRYFFSFRCLYSKNDIFLLSNISSFDLGSVKNRALACLQIVSASSSYFFIIF